MAGLVPAIHVDRPPILRRLSRPGRAPRQDAGKPFPFLRLHHVDGRDKPGHDGERWTVALRRLLQKRYCWSAASWIAAAAASGFISPAATATETSLMTRPTDG